MTDIIFRGPSCKLRGRFYQDKNNNSPIAVVLYPESKNDEMPEVVKSAINVLLDNHFSVFAFNFKRIDNHITDPNQKKEQELFEVIAVLNWINDKYNDHRLLWLFSFFSASLTGLQLVMRRPEITEYILFSPPVKVKDFTFIVPCSSAGLIIYESDLSNSVDEIMEKLLNKSDSCVETMPFEGINIEKNENVEEMLDSLDNYVKKRLIEDTGKTKKIKRDRRRRKKKKTTQEDEKAIHLPPIKSLDFE